MNLDNLQQTLALKDSLAVVLRFTVILNESLGDDASLFDAGSLTADAAQFDSLVSHAEQLWGDSRRLLEVQSYATSSMLSIAAIEELGKIAVARFLLPVNEQRRVNGVCTTIPTRRNPLYSHKQKHQLAAFAGLAINSRADRILGIDNVIVLFDLAESGALERIRQSSLYSEPRDGRIQVPLSIRSRDQSVFLCSVAGELLAELGGLDPTTFNRLLADVQDFEDKHPIPNGYRFEAL